MSTSYASVIASSVAADPVGGDVLETTSGVRILVDISPLPCIGECVAGVLPTTGGIPSLTLVVAGILLLLIGWALIGHRLRTARWEREVPY